MKKIILSLTFVMMSVALMAQAKKPTIMVIPSDAYCARNGYTTEWVDENGTKNTVSDIANIFKQDDVEDLRLVISELSKIMADRGFALKDLEQTLKSIQQETVEMNLLESSSSGSYITESMLDKVVRTAKADIIIDLDFTVMQKGPQRYISYNMRGLDSYTNKVIAANSGVGSPSTSAPVNLLLEEAVLNYMDSFRAQLMAHFEDMSRNGREVVVKLRVWDNADVDFESEFDFEDDYLELTDIISYWMEDNTVNHAPTRTNATATYLSFEQVRIPLYKERNGRMSALDARGFANGLRSYLKKEPFMIESKIYERGLGEVWIIIGEK
ncbi:MAG: hypothetical protein IKW51_10015 [Bacteroidales bacterium]|nr:hypothetical protein [Bacteroidales bacterium]